jgi:ATP-dependent DNA helicase RecG
VKEHSYLGENGIFRTDREYPKFVIQEMVVNSVCHRDYSIKGTEIQIKMFNDRIVFETPGRLPGIVRVDNIRHTHFSRNPKIAEYLKAYEYVKEFGEGVDRMCNELSALGTREPKYSLVAFIMKATVYAMSVAEDDEEKNIKDDVVRDAPEDEIKDAEEQTKGYKKDVKGHEKGHKKDAKGHKNSVETNSDKYAPEAGSNNVNEQGEGQGDRRGKGHKKGIKGRENILGAIIGNPSIAIPSLAERFDYSIKETRTIINQMKADGLIRRVGAKRGGHWEIVSPTKN